jgi:predicted lipid-binding transport protein (Tim44 family)
MSIQQAWDEGDTGRLAAFMTPELYAEMAQQLIARGDAENTTEVSELTCTIEETAQEGELFMVSLRFSGFVSEEGGDEHSFQEIWHIQRPMDGTGRWQLAGIQQMS